MAMPPANRVCVGCNNLCMGFYLIFVDRQSTVQTAKIGSLKNFHCCYVQYKPYRVATGNHSAMWVSTGNHSAIWIAASNHSAIGVAESIATDLVTVNGLAVIDSHHNNMQLLACMRIQYRVDSTPYIHIYHRVLKKLGVEYLNEPQMIETLWLLSQHVFFYRM